MKNLFLFLLFFYSLSFLYAEDDWHNENGVYYHLDKEKKEASFSLGSDYLPQEVMIVPERISHDGVEYKVVRMDEISSIRNVREIRIPSSVREIKRIHKMPLLKKVVLAHDAPVSIFENCPFEDLEELVFEGGELDNFTRIGNILYSKDLKTIYDITPFNVQCFFIPRQVEQLYLNIGEEKCKKLELVLHKNVRNVYVNDELNKHFGRFYFITPLDDAGDESNFFWSLYKSEYRARLVYNLGLERLEGLPVNQKKFLRNSLSLEPSPYYLNPDFSSDVKQLELCFIEKKGGADAHFETIAESGKQYLLKWSLLPVNVRAIPKEGKRIVGYVSFNDTIVGDTCTILNCFSNQSLKVLSAEEGELINGIDYRLSQDQKTLISWRSSALFEDLRKSLLLQDVEKISRNAIVLNERCEELFLPNKTLSLESFFVKKDAAVKKLALSPLMTSLSQDALLTLPLLKSLYIPGTARMESDMLDRALVRQRAHLKHIYVDEENLVAWKDKFLDHPLSSYLTPVPQEVNLTNIATDKVEIVVKDLTRDREFILNQEHPSLSLPRTTHVRLQWKSLPSYAIQQPIVNETALDTDAYESFLLENLDLSSRGEVIKHSIEIAKSSGGRISLFTEQGAELEAKSVINVLRGTRIRVHVEPYDGYIFRTCSINGTVYQENEMDITVGSNVSIVATFYRPKTLVQLSLPSRSSISFTDVHGTLLLPEHIYRNDVIYVQRPLLPDGMKIDRLEVNGVTVTTFPYQVRVQEELKVALTIMPLLHTITLTPKASKYLRITSEDGVVLSTEDKIVDQTKCQVSYAGLPFERLEKCIINTLEYPATVLPLAFTVDRDLSIDVVVREVTCRVFLTFPQQCSVFIGEQEITSSPYEYVGKYMDELKIRAVPKDRYCVKEYNLNGSRYLGNELTYRLTEDANLMFYASPNFVSLSTLVDGNGQILIERKEKLGDAAVRLVASGTSVKVTPVPAKNYYCESLIINGVLQDSVVVEFQPLVDSEIRAVFKPYIWEYRDGYAVCEKINQISRGLNSVQKLTIVEDGRFDIVPCAFATNGVLEELRLEKGVYSVGDSAFYYSTLRAVYLGKDVNSVGTRAFSSCSNLSLVEIEQRDPTLLHFSKDAFSSVKRKPFLRVPNGTSEAFEKSGNYKKFIIVERTIQCTIDGSFFTANDVLPIEFSECGESAKQDTLLNKGTCTFLGGTCLYFTKKKLKTKGVELLVNGQKRNFPSSIDLTQPVTITLNLTDDKSDGNNGGDEGEQSGEGDGDKNNNNDNNNNKNNKDDTPTGIFEQLGDPKSLWVHPNPTTGFLVLPDFLPSGAIYQLVNLTGQVLQRDLLPPSKVLDVQMLRPGLYIVCVFLDEHNYTAKFVKL